MKQFLKPALWSIISLFMLCSFAVPGLNVIAMLLIFVPMTVLYTITNKKVFVVCVIAVIGLASFIVDPLVISLLGLVALIPSIVLGHMYQKQAAATRIIPYVTAIVLLVFMVSLLLLDSLFSVSLISEFKTLLQSQYTMLTDQSLLPSAFTPEMIDMMISSMINLIPLSLGMMAFMLVVITHFIARRIITQLGVNVNAFPQAKDWNLPRKLVFIYFVLYFIELFMDVSNTSFITIAILNLVPALSFAFTVQAIGLFFYLGHHYKWPKIVPILIALPVLFIPFFSILGVIDVAFNLRQRIVKK